MVDLAREGGATAGTDAVPRASFSSSFLPKMPHDTAPSHEAFTFNSSFADSGRGGVPGRPAAGTDSAAFSFSTPGRQRGRAGGFARGPSTPLPPSLPILLVSEKACQPFRSAAHPAQATAWPTEATDPGLAAARACRARLPSPGCRRR